MSGGASEPLSARLTSQASFRMAGCVITRDHLERIWELAREGFPEDSEITVETDRDTSGISSKISSATIAATIAGVRQANLAGDPDYIDNIGLQVSAPIPGSEQSRSVSISIDQEYARVWVRGEDPGWVRGRIGGLKDLLAINRTRFAFLGGEAGFKVFITVLIIGTIAAVWAVNFLFSPYEPIFHINLPAAHIDRDFPGGGCRGRNSWLVDR